MGLLGEHLEVYEQYGSPWVGKNRTQVGVRKLETLVSNMYNLVRFLKEKGRFIRIYMMLHTNGLGFKPMMWIKVWI